MTGQVKTCRAQKISIPKRYFELLTNLIFVIYSDTAVNFTQSNPMRRNLVYWGARRANKV